MRETEDKTGKERKRREENNERFIKEETESQTVRKGE